VEKFIHTFNIFITLSNRFLTQMLEYDYDVVYIQYIKLVKSMVNIDAFSRNPVNLKESTCKVISLLNPNDPKMQKRSLKCWKNQTGRRGLQSLSVR